MGFVIEMYGHYGKAGRFLLAFLTCVLITAAALPHAEAHSGVSLSGYGTATMDGNIGAGEWAASGKVNFGPFGPGNAYSGTLYMMNDGTDLYIAVSISGDGDYGGAGGQDAIFCPFDNNHNGVLETGDDFLGLGTFAPPPLDFLDNFFTTPPSWVFDVPAGTRDGQGAAGHVAANLNHFELNHPLDSADDAHDFSLSVGQTVGFALWVMINGQQYYLSTWGLSSLVAGDASDYANYVVASPPPPAPVGGILTPVNKLEVLAPYLALLGLVGAVTVAVVVQRRRNP